MFSCFRVRRRLLINILLVYLSQPRACLDHVNEKCDYTLFNIKAPDTSGVVHTVARPVIPDGV